MKTHGINMCLIGIITAPCLAATLRWIQYYGRLVTASMTQENGMLPPPA